MQYGDVFTFYMMGKRMTFVLNSQMVPVLSKLEARGLLSNFPTRFEIIPLVLLASALDPSHIDLCNLF